MACTLRPDCTSEQTLRLWRPLRFGNDRGPPSAVLDVLVNGWSQSTAKTYSTGLRNFHRYCDAAIPRVPEVNRAPATEDVILGFISHCAGLYSSSAVRNYVYGVKAWHELHRVSWRISDTVLNLAFRGARRLAPAWTKRTPRDPVTVETMTSIRGQLDISCGLDAAVWACLTTTFWSISRLGEFTVPTLKSFDPAKHIKRSDVQLDVEHGRDRHAVTTFRLPFTKTKADGECAHWAAQSGPCYPRAALLNHLQVNNPALNAHLFSWRSTAGEFKPLTRKAFLDRVNKALQDVGEGPVQGHSLRIGGVLEWLLRGKSFETVKVMGRWASDAFQLYLRKHAAILAPYIQAYPVLEPLAGLMEN